MYKTLGFKWLHECFCPASAFVTADSDEARNPQRFIHVNVIAQCKKTTTVNKMNDRNKMPTAHSGTFACPYTRATASQAKEPEFLPTH